MVQGSHKCSVPNFEEDPFDPTGHRGMVVRHGTKRYCYGIIRMYKRSFALILLVFLKTALLSQHPVMEAGDILFFMGGSTTHGAQAWNNKDHTRRVCIINYLSKDVMIGRL